MRVVVVEDEIKARNGLVKLIKKISPSYEVVGEAANGAEGIKVIEEKIPDLVITDIKMPLMDGIEMLNELKKMGLKHKAIILSAYSDFKFAQDAIRIGIADYLLKPITVDDLKNLLNTIEETIESEKILQQNQALSSPEHLLRNIITGSPDDMDTTINFLAEKYGVLSQKNFGLMSVYLGEAYYSLKDESKKKLISSLSAFSALKYYLFSLEAYRQIIVLFCDVTEAKHIRSYIQNILLNNLGIKDDDNTVLGWICFSGLQNLRSSLDLITQELKWSISLGSNVLISYPEINKIKVEVLSYPIDIEKEMKKSIYSLDASKTHEYSEAFLSFCRQKVYSPSQIIDTVIKFSSSLINVLKEIDYELYMQIDQKNTLNKIIVSSTWHELKAVFSNLIAKIITYNQGSQKVTNLVVKKCLKIIDENYQDITLTKIASLLHVTPEYVSTIFNRELGVNFTAYIKNYRLNKAKEMLVSTNLKTYEIAEKAGFNDPKYFSKVFKDLTGFSPMQYHNIYKK